MIGYFLTRGLVYGHIGSKPVKVYSPYFALHKFLILNSCVTGWCLVICPAFECYKSVEMNKADIEQLQFWCQYWILVAGLTVFERIGDVFIGWIPMYGEAKLAFFVYLWFPKTKGTTYVYDAFFRPYVAKHETEIDRSLLELRTRAGDMALLYCQKSASYAQSRFFDILQYIASQSTPKRPPQPQQNQPASVQEPPAPSDRRLSPTRQPQPPSPPVSSTASSSSSYHPEDDTTEETQSSETSEIMKVDSSVVVPSTTGGPPPPPAAQDTVTEEASGRFTRSMSRRPREAATESFAKIG